jgi:hypothetical protein
MASRATGFIMRSQSYNEAMFRALLFSLLLSALAVGQPPTPPVSNDLKAYLRLTEAQIANIARIDADFAQFQATKNVRIFQVEQELTSETEKPDVDPMALGIRYAEIEAIRRQLRDESGRVHDRIAALLTADQKLAVKSLDMIRAQQQVVSEAECLNILSPAPASIAFTGVLVFSRVGFCFAGITAGFRAGDFSLLPASIFPPISDQLKSYLQLTSTQVSSIESINRTFGQFQDMRFRQSQQLQQQIAMETSKSPLDPMALGTLYAQVEAIRREINDEMVRVRERTDAVLTADQQAKIKILDQAMRLGAEVSDAQCQNLLGPAPPVWITRSSFDSSSSAATGAIGFGGCGLSFGSPAPPLNTARPALR